MTSAKRRSVTVGSVVGLCIVLSVDGRADEPSAEVHAPPPSICDGEYRFTGGASEEAARLRAIEEVVADMNVFVRGIARARLERSTRIPSRVAIDRIGSRTSVRLDAHRYVTETDDEPVLVTSPSGERVRLRHRLAGVVLVETLDGEQGGRINRFACRGRGLRFDVRVHSPRLPRDLVFRTSYGR